MATKFDAGKAIADKILELLDKGVSPWHCPWTAGNGSMIPLSINGRPYRGINIFLLGMQALMKDYKSPYWTTFKKCQELGGKVKKGEKGVMVMYWGRYKKELTDEDGNTIHDSEGKPKTRTFMTIRSYVVFNAEQCEGLADKFYPKPPKEKPSKAKLIKKAEAIWDGYADKPKLNFGSNACYIPSADKIVVPKIGCYKDAQEYYSTLFHEACHSTGHEKRLNRDMRNFFGSEAYGKEELVAEMGAQILCQSVGLKRTLENSAAYCKSWTKAIRSCKDYSKAILCAAQQAQKAADYILGVKYETEEN